MTYPSVYIETTIVSYLASRPSRDLIAAGQQQLTQEWWHTSRGQFALYVSTLVVQEAARGDRNAAQQRLAMLAGIDVLEISPTAVDLAKKLIGYGAVPAEAAPDALHIAVASVNNLDYLLTWNYKHLANATLRETIRIVCRDAGHRAAEICTPAELGGYNVG